MDQFSIHNYLARWKTKSIVSHAALAVVALRGGAVVLFFTFWFIYAIIWFGWYCVSAASELEISERLRLSHEARLICSRVFLLLLFVQYFRTSPLHWGDYPRRN